VRGSRACEGERLQNELRRSRPGEPVRSKTYGRLVAGTLAALSLAMTACGGSSPTVIGSTPKSTTIGSPKLSSNSGTTAYLPVSCSAIQSSVPGGASWEFVGQSDYDSPAQLQPLRAGGIAGVPSNTYPVAHGSADGSRVLAARLKSTFSNGTSPSPRKLGSQLQRIRSSTRPWTMRLASVVGLSERTRRLRSRTTS